MLHIQKHLHIHQRSSLNIFTKSIFHNSQKLSITESGYHQKNKLYWFPVATVTNYYILSGLKQLRFIILHFQKSEIRNGSHWAKRNILAGLCFFLKTSRNNLFCFVFFVQLQKAATYAGSLPSSHPSKPAMVTSFSHPIPLTMTLLPHSSIFKGPRNDIGIIQDHIPDIKSVSWSATLSAALMPLCHVM